MSGHEALRAVPRKSPKVNTYLRAVEAKRALVNTAIDDLIAAVRDPEAPDALVRARRAGNVLDTSGEEGEPFSDAEEFVYEAQHAKSARSHGRGKPPGCPGVAGGTVLLGCRLPGVRPCGYPVAKGHTICADCEAWVELKGVTP